MPTHLTQDTHLAALAEATTHLTGHVAALDPAAPVPTCPGWTVRDLVAHQGAVHRWAEAALRGVDLDWGPLEAEAADLPDGAALAGWLTDGVESLVATIAATPDDAEGVTFLKDAPSLPRFWARRQAHETTVHAVDALAAALGRLPRTEETWVEHDLALDGIDELVLGFVPRRKMTLRSPEPVTLVIHPTDADVAWTVHVTDEPAVSTRHDGPAAVADAVADADHAVTGTATELYLALWHRTDELRTAPIWPLWATSAVL
ncbi:MAG: hypothetical protein CMH83_09045 [Nocardioides sp.]|nr:hypothetical protein [Nocardioides sp.]